jgi:hypothetical protein
MTQERVGLSNEQLPLAYEQALDHLHRGNFNRALRLLRQIEQTQPDYRETKSLILQAEVGQHIQRFVQWVAVSVGSLVFIIGWLLGVRGDMQLLAVGAAGILLGIIVGNVLYAVRASRQ